MSSYLELCGRMREISTLHAVANLLGWDQETMMPPRAAGFRAEELALLGRLAHERLTSPRISELLASCESDRELLGDPEHAANLREWRRDHDRAVRLPIDLVAELNEVASLGLEAWKAARRDDDFAAFRPWLDRLVELNRRKAGCYGHPPGGEAYDALLEDYEPGTTAALLEGVFGPLRAELTPLIGEIAATGLAPGAALDAVRVPIDRQRELNAFVLRSVGFDGDAGRLDVSTHPFSSGIAPGDTRLTTRYREDGLVDAVGSTMHEAGHALYEQGVPRDRRFGEPLGEPLGLGIHESQSRLWENHVGRGRAFWTWLLPHARRLVGDSIAGLSADDLFGAANRVRPHPIRVESDELTYNLHVMLRFDLERALLRGDLATADLPAAWNDRVRADLGLEVRSDAQGCLQDIHWSMGAIGYFPTYTLGTLYAAQLWETASADLGGLDDAIAKGEFAGLLDWLREKLHRHGRRFPADELCRRVTGRGLDPSCLVRHLREKLGALYGLGRSA